MTAPVKLEQDEKKLLLLKMKYILQQIEQLESELQSVIKLNQKLSQLSFAESLSVLNQTDPEIVRLKQEFNRFSQKNEKRRSQDLIEIHSGVKKLLKVQLQRIMEFSEQELPIDKAVIVKTAQAIRKSSKTIIAIESLLSLRGEQHFDPVNLNHTNKKLEKKIDYIDNKENTLNTTIKIIENVTPKGEQDEEYQALIEHLKTGGSLDEIESKFQVEKIDITVSDEMEKVTPAFPFPSIAQKPEEETDKIVDNNIEQDSDEQEQIGPKQHMPSSLRLFWLVLSKWLNTPAGVNWKIAKQQVLEKYQQR